MKRIVVFVLMTGAMKGISAQSVNSSSAAAFDSAMLANIRQLDTAGSGASLLRLANNFERIGNVEKIKWQPFYYAAYCYTAMAFMTGDKKMIDPLADKADVFLIKAKALEKNNSELSCMEAMINSCRITVDPISRFTVLNKEVQAKLAQAKEENPDNPRIYLMEARLQLRTPEAFGGGKIIAQKSVETAVEKFKRFIKQDALSPSWGAEQAQLLFEKINAQ